MWLDADDVMPSESRTEIQNLKVSIFSDKEVDAVIYPYNDDPDSSGRYLKVCRERFFRREAAFRWEGWIHESVTRSRDRTEILAQPSRCRGSPAISNKHLPATSVLL